MRGVWLRLAMSYGLTWVQAMSLYHCCIAQEDTVSKQQATFVWLARLLPRVC